MSWWHGISARFVPYTLVGVEPGRLSAAHCLDDLPARSALQSGCAALLIGGGVVQATLQPSRWPQPLARIKQRRDSWRDPGLVVWSAGRLGLRFVIPTLVSRDGHGVSAVVNVAVRLEPQASEGGAAPAIPANESELIDTLVHAAGLQLREEARSVDGATMYDEWPADQRISGLVAIVAREALAGVARVESEASVAIESEYFQAGRQRRVSLTAARADAEVLREKSLIRGEALLAAREEQLLRLQHEADIQALTDIVWHDNELKRRALARELARDDVEMAMGRAEHAKRQAEAVMQLIDAASRVHAKTFESASQLAAHLAAQFDSPTVGSVFNAQDRQRARDLLADAARHASSPQEILASMREGLPQTLTFLRPLRPLLGSHAFKAGLTLRAFDGETLWTLVALRAVQQRRGWLRMRRVDVLEVKIIGRPDGRESLVRVDSTGTALMLGRHELSLHLHVPQAGGHYLTISEAVCG